MPPVGEASSGVVDPPLLPQSSLTLGFGDNADVDPLNFFLPAGAKKDIGFLKLFLTAIPVDLDSLILQESPFQTTRASGAAQLSARLSVPEPWTSQLATVIQVDSKRGHSGIGVDVK